VKQTQPADRSTSSRTPLHFDSGPLADLAPRVPFFRGSELGAQGEPCDSLYLIERGQILLSRRNEGGESHALYLLGPGDLLGEGAIHPYRRWLVTARAATDGFVHVLPAGQFPRLAQHFPQLVTHLVSLLTERLERAHLRLDVISCEGARQRVMGLLRTLARYHGVERDSVIAMELAVTQAELGEMVGLTRETVARALAELEAEGLLQRRRGRGMWSLTVPVEPP
jgi:CRP-like cAMP-binding protein